MLLELSIILLDFRVESQVVVLILLLINFLGKEGNDVYIRALLNFNHKIKNFLPL